MHKALFIENQEPGSSVVKEIRREDLPSLDTLVSVEYSSLNYKDALAITGTGKIVRKFPMIPGIDLAGTVLGSESNAFEPGQKILVNGFGIGEAVWGGLSQLARMKSEWVLPVPNGLTTKQAMGIGTAGYTAMLCVIALEDSGVTPSHGPIVVSGATGGVGSFAISILSSLGFEVFAVTGKQSSHDYLKGLGAHSIIERETLSGEGKILDKERWAGAVDTLGGHTLANICASAKYNGVITACGMAQSLKFPASVAPFILRAVKLVGIDSVFASLEQRQRAWARLAALDLHDRLLAIETIGIHGCAQAAETIVKGNVVGRFLVDLSRS